MRSFLVNKNLCLYYWLKKKIGKKWAFGVANAIEKIILIFGREIMPYFNRNGKITDQQESVLEGICREKIWIRKASLSQNNLPKGLPSKAD